VLADDAHPADAKLSKKPVGADELAFSEGRMRRPCERCGGAGSSLRSSHPRIRFKQSLDLRHDLGILAPALPQHSLPIRRGQIHQPVEDLPHALEFFGVHGAPPRDGACPVPFDHRSRKVLPFMIRDGAMDKLRALDPRVAQVADLRLFWGFDGAETAEATGLSRSTVDRDWRFARAWLSTQLQPS